uniref:DUF547 domain-containing protein n=1 Tax=Alexandrium monilatum TaxID=311494 RepID=A0A7S4R279_9DINO
MPSGRGVCPFTLTFQPHGPDEANCTYKAKVIPINTGAPVEIENEHFKGRVMLVHDTGNEPGESKELPGKDEKIKHRGVELQIQGKFKHQITQGDLTSSGIWAGGELQDQLKLGWIMNNVVQLCVKYARKKTEGRVHMNISNKVEKPQMSFPVTQLFSIAVTPAGAEPPKLNTEEMEQIKWQGAKPLPIDPECTYTLVFSCPFIDICSWELLKVPGVSPLPLETLLGDISEARVILYDLGVAGSQENMRKGALLEWFFSRGSAGDAWPQEEEAIADGQKTPLEEASDGSEEGVAEGEEEEDEDEVLIAVDDKEDCVDSESSDESLESDEEALSRADSQALFEIESWRPRQVSESAVERMQVCVPYYIEAIDRRRRRKVRIWYVFSMTNPDGDEDWWHAKAEKDLAELCRPRRRLQTFRRGRGARGYTCCAVKTLETFRHVVCQHLERESRLRTVVTSAAASETVTPKKGSDDEAFEDLSPSHLTPAGLARKVRGKRGRKGPLLPPRFFVGIGAPACGLAFAHAREGRLNAIRETLVGAIHFEGRLCEELLRLSGDGIIRCFTPYDCTPPRVRLLVSEVLSIECPEGLFLGRFYLWQVHTPLRVFSFCSASLEERDEWIAAIEGCLASSPTTAAATPVRAGGSDGWIKDMAETPVCSSGTKGMITPRIPSRMRAGEGQALPPLIAALLMDSTRARRWRQARRLVLNDRRIISDVVPPSSRIAERLLEMALGIGEEPTTSQLTAFMDATCQLKAVRFAGWKQEELLAFWLNLYHCLLLHGWLLLGTPRSQSELTHFFNRVSYLVGLRPMSLREIEQVILHVPRVLSQEAVRAQARARAKQLFGFINCCCRRRPKRKGSTLSNTGTDESVCSNSTASCRSSKKVAGGDASQEASKGSVCLPMPNLPRPASFFRGGMHVCLFLDNAPESPSHAIPKEDLRALLIMNGCNKGSMASIPVFHAARLNSELDDIAQQFVAQFVEVDVKDGRVTKAVLPHGCYLIKQELMGKGDMQALLKFLWKFMPEGSAKPTGKTQIKFQGKKEEMRKRVEMVKAVYTDSSLNVPLPPEALPPVAPPSEARPLGRPSQAADEAAAQAGPIVALEL